MSDNNKEVTINLSEITGEELYEAVILSMSAREYLELFKIMTREIAVAYPPIRNLK